MRAVVLTGTCPWACPQTGQGFIGDTPKGIYPTLLLLIFIPSVKT